MMKLRADLIKPLSRRYFIYIERDREEGETGDRSSDVLDARGEGKDTMVSVY